MFMCVAGNIMDRRLRKDTAILQESFCGRYYSPYRGSVSFWPRWPFGAPSRAEA